MSMPPCKDCVDRKVGCHSTCQKYLDYRKDVDAEKREKKRYADAESYVIESILKQKKKRSRR